MTDMKKTTPPSTTGKWVGGIGILIILIAIVYGGNKNTKLAPSEKTASAATAPADYPLCAGGKYNFSNTRKGEVAVEFKSNCVSEIVLPFQIAFRLDSPKDVKIDFLDGKSIIDGPNRRSTWAGYERSSTFIIRGLDSNGIMKISLGEKRKEVIM